MDLPSPFISLVSLIAIGALGLVLRWAVGADTDKRLRKDYGLLKEIATVPSTTSARYVEQRLLDAGVRATTVPAEDGKGLRILVFPADERVAVRTLLADRSAD